VQVTFGQAVGSENLARSTLSSRWPDQPTFVHLTDRERGLTRSSDTDARMDPQDRMPPVASKERFAVAERPSESIISSDRMLLAVPVGALALAATKGCMLKHSATRRPCRGDRLDQRGAARVPQTFFAPVSPIRRATVVRGPPEPSDRSCAIEELRRICCSKLNTAPSHDGPVSGTSIQVY